jgi:hypothetical protein
MTNELDYDNVDDGAEIGNIVGYKLITGEEVIARYARCVKDRLFKKVEGHIVNYPSVLNKDGEFVPWLQILDTCCHGGDIFLPVELVALILDEEVLDPVLVEKFRENVLCPILCP